MKPIRIPTLNSEQLDALEKFYRTGETVVLIRRRERRSEVAELLEALF
jgi:hypothetical protein